MKIVYDSLPEVSHLLHLPNDEMVSLQKMLHEELAVLGHCKALGAQRAPHRCIRGKVEVQGSKVWPPCTHGDIQLLKQTYIATTYNRCTPRTLFTFISSKRCMYTIGTITISILQKTRRPIYLSQTCCPHTDMYHHAGISDACLEV